MLLYSISPDSIQFSISQSSIFSPPLNLFPSLSYALNHCPRTLRSSKKTRSVKSYNFQRRNLTLLRQKQPISLLQRNPMSGVFIIWRKPRRMRRFGDFSRNNLLQCVYTLALLVEGVHEMHICGLLLGSRECSGVNV